ncbi:MAG: hypothetical protein WCD82_09890, partial [Xanthobacteraceae bacterium]
GVFDDGFGIRSKVRFDRRVARVREAENRQFGTFCLRGSERKLGQAALDRSEVSPGLRQAGWIQAISDEVAAQPTIVAESAIGTAGSRALSSASVSSVGSMRLVRRIAV